MTWLFSLVSLCLLASSWAANVVTPCEEGQPANYDKVQVFVDDVECTETPCLFKHGSDATCQITFTAKNTITELHKRVNATVIGTGVVTPFPLPNANKGCDDLLDGGYCPVDSGEQVTLAMTMPVSPIYPKVDLLLKFFMLDQLDTQQGCFIVPAKVV